VTAPSRATIAGQAYLDLRTKARQDRRPVDELIQLYVLEGFLARLAQTPRSKRDGSKRAVRMNGPSGRWLMRVARCRTSRGRSGT
jgi:hypothetical protein